MVLLLSLVVLIASSTVYMMFSRWDDMHALEVMEITSIFQEAAGRRQFNVLQNLKNGRRRGNQKESRKEAPDAA